MTQATSINEPPTTEAERPARRKRARKKRYSDEIYGARLAHEDARIVDEFARHKKMEKSDVVRLALHQFALRQGMQYKPKDAFDQLSERVYREHFALVHEQLQTITGTLAEMPGQLIAANSQAAFRTLSETDEKDSRGATGALNPADIAGHFEQLSREQRRTLEPVLLASTLTLRLLINYVVEPKLGALDLQNPQAVVPFARHAARGKEAWNLLTVALMKITGDQVMRELGMPVPDERTGTPDAQQQRTDATDAQRLIAALFAQAGIAPPASSATL